MEKQNDNIESTDGELSEEDLSGVAGGMNLTAMSKKPVAAEGSHAGQSSHLAEGAHGTGHAAPQSVHHNG